MTPRDIAVSYERATVSYDELFDGEEHWLEEEGEPGWICPWLRVLHTVDMEVQPASVNAKGSWESPITNIVTDETTTAISMSWAVENGWSGFAVMVQQIGQLLSPPGNNKMKVEQLVARDKNWKVTDSHYRVEWTGDPKDVEGI
jgi:hypothetical protein